MKTKQQIEDEYHKIQAPAYAKYYKIKETAYAKYYKIQETAYAEYNKIEETAWAERNRKLEELETITIGGIKYSKDEVEKALQGIKEIK